MLLSIFLRFVLMVVMSRSSELPAPEILISGLTHQHDYDLLRRPLFKDAITVFCRYPRGVRCGPEDLLEIQEESAGALQVRPCGFLADAFTEYHGYYGARFDFNLTWGSQVLGNVACRHRVKTAGVKKVSETIRLPAVACGENSRACQQTVPCDTSSEMTMCALTKKGLELCYRPPDPSHCIKGKDSERYCPVNELGFCAAAIRNYSATWFRYWEYNSSSCPSISTPPPFSYKGRDLRYGDVIELDPDDKNLRLRCPRGSPFYNRSITLPHLSFENYESPCVDEQNLTLLVGRWSNSAIKVQDMDFRIQTGEYSWTYFSYKVIWFDEPPEINISESNPAYVRCSLLSAPEVRLVKLWWTKNSTGDKRYYATADHQWLTPYNATERDEFQCHVEMEYKTCLPQRRISKVLHSKTLAVGPTAGAVRTGNKHPLATVILLYTVFLTSRLW